MLIESRNKSLNFTIVPQKTKITSLDVDKTSFTAKWQKSAAVDGYQIRYAKKLSMADARIITIKTATATSRKVSGLKSNQNYYVQVRTYKTVDGKNYYSSWSKKLNAKTAIKINVATKKSWAIRAGGENGIWFNTSQNLMLTQVVSVSIHKDSSAA